MCIKDRMNVAFESGKYAYNNILSQIESGNFYRQPFESQLMMLDWYISMINRQMVVIRDIMTKYKGFESVQQLGQSQLNKLFGYVLFLTDKYEKMTDY